MKGLCGDGQVQSTKVVDGVCLMFGSLVANAKRMSKMNLNFWDQDLEVGILGVPGAVSFL